MKLSREFETLSKFTTMFAIFSIFLSASCTRNVAKTKRATTAEDSSPTSRAPSTKATEGLAIENTVSNAPNSDESTSVSNKLNSTKKNRKLEISCPYNIKKSSCFACIVRIKNLDDEFLTAEEDLELSATLDLSKGSMFVPKEHLSCGTVATSVTIPKGTFEQKIYFKLHDLPTAGGPFPVDWGMKPDNYYIYHPKYVKFETRDPSRMISHYQNTFDDEAQSLVKAFSVGDKILLLSNSKTIHSNFSDPGVKKGLALWLNETGSQYKTGLEPFDVLDLEKDSDIEIIDAEKSSDDSLYVLSKVTSREDKDSYFMVTSLKSNLEINQNFGIAGKIIIKDKTLTPVKINLLPSKEFYIVSNREYHGESNSSNKFYEIVVQRYLSTGALSLNFGSYSSFRTFTLADSSSHFKALNSLVQPDEKLLITGDHYTSSLKSEAFVTRIEKYGAPDFSFNSGKYLKLEDSDSIRRRSKGKILLQPDGKILVHFDRYLYRKNKDGTYDNTFGESGSVRIKDSVSDFSLLADGSIVEVLTYDKIKLKRILKNGDFDSSFGSAGTLSFRPELLTGYRLTDNQLIPFKGGFIVAGDIFYDTYMYSFRPKTVAATMIKSNFTFDENFGNRAGRANYVYGVHGQYLLDQIFDVENQNIITIGIGQENNIPLLNGKKIDGIESFSPYKVAIDHHGDYILAGGTTRNGKNTDFMAIKVKRSGELDYKFGKDGIFQIDVGGADDYLNGVGITKNGDIILSGYSYSRSSENEVIIVKLTDDGVLDRTFGSLGTLKMKAPAKGLNNVSAMKILDNDKILIAGTVNTGIKDGHSVGDFGAVQLLPNGEIDKSFGSLGWALFDGFGNGDLLYSMDVQIDGKILLAGFFWDGNAHKGSNAVARVDSSGHVDWRFGVGGKVTVPQGTVKGRVIAPYVTVGLDGKIYLAGKFTDDGDAKEIISFFPDGQINSEFGDAGILKSVFGDHDGAYMNRFVTTLSGNLNLIGSGFSGFSSDWEYSNVWISPE